MTQVRPSDQMTPEELSEFWDQPLATHGEDWIRQQRIINDVSLGAAWECAPSETELRNLDDAYNELNEEALRVRRQYEDPYVRDTLAPQVFKSISNFTSAYYSFDERQNDYLKNIIEFGLSHGLTEDDLIVISSELDWVVGASEYLYGMMDVVSLSVAKILYENRYLYGIFEEVSPVYDFRAFVDRNNHLIANGDVGVRVMTVGDAIGHPIAHAYYDPAYNEFVFPPMEDEGVIAADIGTPPHEAGHVFEDDFRISWTKWESEYSAEWDAEWITQVLDRADGVDDWDASGFLDELYEEIEGLEEAKARRQLQCLGYDEDTIKFIEEMEQEIAYRYANWQNAVTDEIEGYDSRSAEAFSNYYALANFSDMVEIEYSYWVMEYDGLSEEELRDEWDYAARDLIRAGEKWDDMSSFQNVSEWAEATYDYVSQLQRVRILAHELDRNLWKKLTDILYGQVYEIARGLMFVPVIGDGV